jgi:16S rRNA (uracil1498-N3)-methyltransferase
VTLPVFLTPLEGAVEGAEVELAGEEGRHAVVVRRTRVGEHVVLADGCGTRAVCEVLATTKATLTARVERVETVPREHPHVTVVQALAKGDRGELAVELLTEVGVDRIVPWAASRSVAVWRGDRAGKSLARWRSTSREAAKQARRAWLPEVTEPVDTQAVAALLEQGDLAVVLHEAATTDLAALDVPRAGSVVVVVGPEGGISDQELEVFRGAHVVRLGSSVLRTSSAGLAAVAALLSRTDRWRVTR